MLTEHNYIHSQLEKQVNNVRRRTWSSKVPNRRRRISALSRNRNQLRPSACALREFAVINLPKLDFGQVVVCACSSQQCPECAQPTGIEQIEGLIWIEFSLSTSIDRCAGTFQYGSAISILIDSAMLTLDMLIGSHDITRIIIERARVERRRALVARLCGMSWINITTLGGGDPLLHALCNIIRVLRKQIATNCGLFIRSVCTVADKRDKISNNHKQIFKLII